MSIKTEPRVRAGEGNSTGGVISGRGERGDVNGEVDGTLGVEAEVEKTVGEGC